MWNWVQGRVMIKIPKSSELKLFPSPIWGRQQGAVRDGTLKGSSPQSANFSSSSSLQAGDGDSHPSEFKRSETEGMRGREKSHLTSTDLALLFCALQVFKVDFSKPDFVSYLKTLGLWEISHCTIWPDSGEAFMTGHIHPTGGPSPSNLSNVLPHPDWWITKRQPPTPAGSMQPCTQHWWLPEYRMAVCSTPPAQLPYRSPVSLTDHLLRIPSFSSKLFCWGPKKTHPLLCVHCPPIQRIENQPLILVIDGNATPHQVQPSFLWASGRQIYTQPFGICFFCCEMQGRLLHHPRSRGRSSGFPRSTLQEGWSEGKHIPPTLLPAYLEHAKDSLNSNFLPLSASWTSTLSWYVWLKDTGGLASLA